jgi:hypothetical protein
MQATLNDLKDSQATHAQDREKLAELEDLKVQYEERLMELSDITEGLKEENDALREDARHWKERSDAYFDENVELHGIAENLRIENGGLKAEVCTNGWHAMYSTSLRRGALLASALAYQKHRPGSTSPIL